MFMSAMVQIFSCGERWNVLFNKAKPSWLEHFIFHRMEIFVPLHEWKTFIICFIKVVQWFIFLDKFRRKNIENDVTKAKTYTSQESNSTREVLFGYLRLAKPRTAPAAFPHVEFLHLIFLISLILKANVQRLHWKYWTL